MMDRTTTTPLEPGTMPDTKQLPLRLPADWHARLAEMADEADTAAAQYLRAILHPLLTGHVTAEFYDGALLSLSGRDAAGRKQTFALDGRPLRKAAPISAPISMGRPRKDN